MLMGQGAIWSDDIGGEEKEGEKVENTTDFLGSYDAPTKMGCF